MNTPAPVVRVILHELLAVLEGRTMRVRDDQGQDVDLRLFRAEEFLAVQHALVDESGHGSKVTWGKASDLTQPIKITGATPL